MTSRALQPCPAAPDRLFWMDGFLRPAQCERIKAELAFAYWQPSKLYVKTGERSYQYVYSDKRVSDSTSEWWFPGPLKQTMAAIDRRIAALIPQLPSHREEWQATRYPSGGRFDLHFDHGYFADEPAGERTHTVLLYLDTPRRGGATKFPRLGAAVDSQAGRLVIWRNLKPDGSGDPEMLHAGAPLRAGRKTILTTWIRQRPFRPTGNGERP